MKSKWFEREWWAAVILAVFGLLGTLGVTEADDAPLIASITSLLLIVLPAGSFIVMKIWQKISADKTAALVKVEEAKTAAKEADSAARIKEAEFLMKVEEAKSAAKIQVAKEEAKVAIATAVAPVEVLPTT